jgi:hypothetical protein
MTLSAERLMIVRIPEEHHIAFMRIDVIRTRCGYHTQWMPFLRIYAQRMLSQTRLTVCRPLARITTLVSAGPCSFCSCTRAVLRCTCIAVSTRDQRFTSWPSTWTLRH